MYDGLYSASTKINWEWNYCRGFKWNRFPDKKEKEKHKYEWRLQLVRSKLHFQTYQDLIDQDSGRTYPAQRMKFSIKDFFGKCNQIRRKLRIWSHLLKKFLMKNIVFWSVNGLLGTVNDMHSDKIFWTLPIYYFSFWFDLKRFWCFWKLLTDFGYH